LLVYFTTRLYDYQNSDEERRPWNDPTIIEPKTGQAFDWNRPLEMSACVEIIFVDPRLWSRGWQLYEQRPDKAWSLTDCISILVMQEQGLKDALTNDR